MVLVSGASWFVAFGSFALRDVEHPGTQKIHFQGLRGLAARGAQPFPGRTAERRALWAEFGIVCDELSAPVLVLNLGVTGPAPLADLVFSAPRAGQPIHLSTRLLWSTPWEDLAFPSRVFVCENPTVVALAASRFGPRCPPLICVDGEPKTAARILLRILCARGADLHYHGDFDWAGIAIAERVFRQFGAVPWLFDADAYGKARGHTGRSLQGGPVSTPWSPRLSEEMRIRGTAYDEELLADILLDDLARFSE